MTHAYSTRSIRRPGQWRSILPAALIALAFAGVGTAAQQPTSAPSTTRASDAELDRLLEADEPTPGLSLPRVSGGGTDRTSGAGALAPDAPVVRLLREGTYLIDRVGRVAVTGDGQQFEFVFDADGTTLQDPPMVLVPNLNLMAVESALRSEPDRRFRVSGRVTEYHGRNHLILEKVVILR